jgi:hypothetical protein
MLKNIKLVLITSLIAGLSILTYFLFSFLKIIGIGITILCVGYTIYKVYGWMKSR